VQQGVAPLSELAGAIASAQLTVVLLAASDVTLLSVKIPPMSHAKLKVALPNMVEDRLLGDPADCVIVANNPSDGLHTVAVIQRGWLNQIANTLMAFGAQQIKALPAQLCLAYKPDQTGDMLAAINEHNTDIDVVLRYSEYEGIGLNVSKDHENSDAYEIIQALSAIARETKITLHVPLASVVSYQNELNAIHNKHINVLADTWQNWINGAGTMQLDLMDGLGTGKRPSMDLRAWRWPLVLSTTLLLINIIALNLDWWHMKREADSLRTTMTQLYRSTYPDESVIIDPIAQVKQKIAAAKHNSGLAAPDDFTTIMSAFGEAWSSVVPATGIADAPAIAAFEYSEHSLIVRLKPGNNVPTQQMKTALAGRNLALELSPDKSTGAVWHIRSIR